MFSFHQKLVQ